MGTTPRTKTTVNIKRKKKFRRETDKAPGLLHHLQVSDGGATEWCEGAILNTQSSLAASSGNQAFSYSSLGVRGGGLCLCHPQHKRSSSHKGASVKNMGRLGITSRNP